MRTVVFRDCVILRGHFLNPILVALAKHEAFLKARGRHYSNEAEAMKVRTFPFFFPLEPYSSPFVLCALIGWTPSLARGETYGGR